MQIAQQEHGTDYIIYGHIYTAQGYTERKCHIQTWFIASLIAQEPDKQITDT